MSLKLNHADFSPLLNSTVSKPVSCFLFAFMSYYIKAFFQ